MTYASKNPKTLESNLNYDLKNLTKWLCANRLSLNKTKLLIFHSKYKTNEYEDLNIKLQGVRLETSCSVNYLGVHIDNNLSWDYHVKELSKKLSRTNGILCKLRHYVPLNTMLSVYYALFYSHMTYGSLIWSLTTQKNLNIILILQKKCIRILNSVSFNEHTNLLFYNNKIIKFPDVVKTNQLLFVKQFINKNLPDDLINLFTFSTNIHNYITRSSMNSGLFIPKVSSTNYGLHSLKYVAPCAWNDFSRVHPEISKFNNTKTFKKYINNFFLEQYKSEK